MNNEEIKEITGANLGQIADAAKIADPLMQKISKLLLDKASSGYHVCRIDLARLNANPDAPELVDGRVKVKEGHDLTLDQLNDLLYELDSRGFDVELVDPVGQTLRIGW